MAYIHSCKIIHRDVKPSTFLYNKHLRVGKLIDFGLAEKESEIRYALGSEHIMSFNKLSLMLSQSFGTVSLVVPMRKCLHDGKSICEICLARKKKKVSRGGTPGYRAPEVLLNYQKQTSAIDVWSAGVTLLSILSCKSPFFSAHDDLSAFAEIMSIFGSQQCIEAAKGIGISLFVSDDIPGVQLDEFCVSLRAETMKACKLLFPQELFALLLSMLTLSPLKRIAAENALSNLKSLDYFVFR